MESYAPCCSGKCVSLRTPCGHVENCRRLPPRLALGQETTPPPPPRVLIDLAGLCCGFVVLPFTSSRGAQALPWLALTPTAQMSPDNTALRPLFQWERELSTQPLPSSPSPFPFPSLPPSPTLLSLPPLLLLPSLSLSFYYLPSGLLPSPLSFPPSLLPLSPLSSLTALP